MFFRGRSSTGPSHQLPRSELAIAMSHLFEAHWDCPLRIRLISIIYHPVREWLLNVS